MTTGKVCKLIALEGTNARIIHDLTISLYEHFDETKVENVRNLHSDYSNGGTFKS